MRKLMREWWPAPLGWCLAAALLAFGGGAGAAPADDAPGAWDDLKLRYDRPAGPWEEALPVGNGRLGAMAFGRVADERIQFNEDTLWTGKPHDYVRAGAIDQLPALRRLLFEGKDKEAIPIIRQKFLSDPVLQKMYQPFGDLLLHFPAAGEPEDYRRELDLDAAIARVSYKSGGVTHRREVFASRPDGAIVVRIEADRPGAVAFRVRMTSPHESAAGRVVDSVLATAGRVQDDGLRFESRLRVLHDGGRLKLTDEAAEVEGADSATLLLVAATSYRNFQDISADPAERCASALARIGDKPFAAIRADHMADHRRLFRRVRLDLGRTPEADLTTDRRLTLMKAKGGPLAPTARDAAGRPAPVPGLANDPALGALYFQFGRYLLIASSRPGDQPANLQGVWNELLDPPWGSKYTTNINVEMNYWPAEVTNLSECHEPLFDLVDDLVVSGGRTAGEQYGARGWVVHHNTDHWRGSAPINNIDGVWPTGGAWLCHHLWEHYLFTGDRDFLARRAYPALRGASLFFVDVLVRDPKTGHLVTNPSISPEQDPLCVGPTMDNQLIRALLGYTIEATRILGVDAELAGRLAEVRAQVPPNLVGKHGQLQEWLDDVDKPNNNHRHMSPLWGLYPGADITPADPKVFDAAKLLLTWRGDGNTGWSFAWRIPLWARVHDGDFAYRQLCIQLDRRTFPNLFDKCGPFQVDGNLGATGGVAEMLLQSHLRAGDEPADRPVVELLPALPAAWARGSVSGLRARGGFEVAMDWDGGRLARAVVRSDLGRPCQVRAGDQVAELALKAGESANLDAQLRPAAAARVEAVSPDRAGVVRSEFLYESAPYPACHASTIAEARGGLVAAWFGGTAEREPDVGIWVARRDGDAWSTPVEVARGEEGGKRLPCWNPVLFQPDGGPLLLFYKVGPNPREWWGMLATSDDGGRTWSAGRKLPDGILGPIKNKPIARPGGLILCPSSVEDGAGWRVHFETTGDLGRTWRKTPDVAGPQFHAIQPSVLTHADGRLQALCRTRESRIVETWSADGGATWSDLVATPLPNPNSGTDAVTLADGRQLLVYNHNPAAKGRTPLNLAASADGKSWEAGPVLEDEPGEFSYPAIIQAADGLVHVTYTWNRRRIRHVVVDPARLALRPIVDGRWPGADAASGR